MNIYVIKYGGNAMTDAGIREELLAEVARLHNKGEKMVLVHGGGPEIKKLLSLGKVESEFIGGHRKTTAEAMYYVQLALRGEVNGSLVSQLNNQGVRAVGLSAKDGRMAEVKRRYHLAASADGSRTETDLGQVGDIIRFDPALVQALLGANYLPVLSPVAQGDDGLDYNINADAMAGAVAAALRAKAYISLTDVDGLYENWPDPASRIDAISLGELKKFCATKASGGMLPKLESVIFALENGAGEAHIINGTKPAQFAARLQGGAASGTRITLT
ncbi:MAG: acetylglutamate kinase [Candidatus Cyclonatronum sp.]|uniref:acetylglutamate kinase n=1 Tax=Cyclonatronum sp. TaxID=3024185 RepID=UPI0025C700B8|nr:acetylglutamate kinase [Cyclonatronum sp.]MCH8485403.1 acetylglutamate kinase [Cyclonatronum sp.]